MNKIDEAAAYLATTPGDKREYPLIPHLQKTYGLTLKEAMEAIRESHMKLARAN